MGHIISLTIKQNLVVNQTKQTPRLRLCLDCCKITGPYFGFFDHALPSMLEFIRPGPRIGVRVLKNRRRTGRLASVSRNGILRGYGNDLETALDPSGTSLPCLAAYKFSSPRRRLSLSHTHTQNFPNCGCGIAPTCLPPHAPRNPTTGDAARSVVLLRRTRPLLHRAPRFGSSASPASSNGGLSSSSSPLRRQRPQDPPSGFDLTTPTAQPRRQGISDLQPSPIALL